MPDFTREVTIGIEPGLTGGVAALHADGTTLLYVGDMPTFPVGRTAKGHARRGVCSNLLAHVLMNQMTFDPEDCVAYVEQVGARPEQGASSVFNFGVGYGIVQGVLGARFIPYQFITPRKWRAAVSLTGDKGAARGMASRLFPSWADHFTRVKDDGRAEAALIAVAAQRLVKQGKL